MRASTAQNRKVHHICCMACSVRAAAEFATHEKSKEKEKLLEIKKRTPRSAAERSTAARRPLPWRKKKLPACRSAYIHMRPSMHGDFRAQVHVGSIPSVCRLRTYLPSLGFSRERETPMICTEYAEGLHRPTPRPGDYRSRKPPAESKDGQLDRRFGSTTSIQSKERFRSQPLT